MPLVYATPEQIGASLETALKSIVGVNKLQRVDRQHHEDFDNYAYPSGYINDVRRDITRVLKNVLKVVHTFDIIVFGRSEGGDLATLLNTLMDDSCAAIIADPTRGGIAYNTRVLRTDTDEGFYEPVYVAAIMVEVHYLARK
jgi:hypothetical protein